MIVAHELTLLNLQLLPFGCRTRSSECDESNSCKAMASETGMGVSADCFLRFFDLRLNDRV